MSAVEFLAFGAYVRKVFRNDEDDDGDKGNGTAGLRCRLWSKEKPSEIKPTGYDKKKTFIVDLTQHPGATPNFLEVNKDRLHCEAPGFTAIGQGTANLDSFETSDDYVNRIYLNSALWANLSADVQPEFPPMKPESLSVRKIGLGPMDYEFKILTFATDDSDQDRRGRRYIGYYADVMSLVPGSTTLWLVRVFNPGESSYEEYQLDFSKKELYAPETKIKGAAGSFGALYLDSIEAWKLQTRLPKLPVSEDDSTVPPPLTIGTPMPTSVKPPVPKPELLEALAKRQALL